MQNSERLIAIDYGTKKSGIAYAESGFAFAWKTVPTGDIFPALHTCIGECENVRIILGMPYNIDGSQSTHGRRVLLFQEQLREHFPFPIVLVDEGLTSAEARMNFASDNTQGDIDSESARLILERYLEDSR